MRCCSWFNVRLMNCEIFIFTSKFLGPFLVLSYGGGGGGGGEGWIKPSLLDC